MSAAVSPSSGRPYGLAAVCRVWNISRATLYRRRTLRLMRGNDQLAPSRTGVPKGPRNHDGTIIPDAIDVM